MVHMKRRRTLSCAMQVVCVVVVFLWSTTCSSMLVSSFRPNPSFTRRQPSVWGGSRSRSSSTSTSLYQSSKPSTSLKKRRKRGKQGKLRRIKDMGAATVKAKTSPRPDEAYFLGSRGIGALTEHAILTKAQEMELGRAIQKSIQLQSQLQNVVLAKREEMANQAVELKESQDEWFALMGRGNSKPFPSLGDADDDDDDDELASLSVVDSASWFQPTIQNEDALDQGPLLEQFSESQVWQDADLDILSENDVQEQLGMSKMQLQSILLEGAVARDTLIRCNVRLVVNIAKKWCQQQARGDKISTVIYQGSWDRPSLDEAVQEGIVGLIGAADRFDPERNLKFSTYATFYITNKVRRCFRSFSTPSVKIPAAYYDIKSKLKTLVRDYHMAGEEVPPPEELAKEIGVTWERLHLVLRGTRTAASIDAPVMTSRFTSAGKAGSTENDEFLLADTLVDDGELPEDGVEWSFLRQSLETAMANELAPHERDVVRLRLGLDDGVTRTVKQVAEECGGWLSIHEIRRAEKRAFRKLRSPNSLATYKFLAYLDFAGIDSSTTNLD